MKPLAGRPLAAHVLERVRAVRGIDDIVLATSVNDRDEPLAVLAADMGYRAWRGSEHDVLGRFVGAAAALHADIVMRITGDCPFTAPEVCERVLCTALSGDPWADYVSNDVTSSGYPDGTDCEVFTMLALLRANVSVTDRLDREHVTPWMKRNLPSKVVRSFEDWGHLKLSVDCEEDLLRARSIFGYLPPCAFALRDTLVAWQKVQGSRRSIVGAQ